MLKRTKINEKWLNFFKKNGSIKNDQRKLKRVFTARVYLFDYQTNFRIFIFTLQMGKGKEVFRNI